jgi:hypothetical protein
MSTTTSSSTFWRSCATSFEGPAVDHLPATEASDRNWQKSIVRGLDQRLDMPEIGVTLSLAEIYDGVEFPARPRLVPEEDAAPARESVPKGP